jgi:predicted Zn-dependent protease
MAVDVRAGNNLQACLVGLGMLEEAAGLGAELAARDPDSPTSPANTARALVGLQRLEEAEAYALQAVERAPERCVLWVLLGNIRGQRGALDGALAAFDEALERGSACDVEAHQGLKTVARIRASSIAPTPLDEDALVEP